MLSINVHQTNNRQSLLARKPVDSIRSSFKSTQFSVLPKYTHPNKCRQAFIPTLQVAAKLNLLPPKAASNNVKTIEHSRKKPPSAYSRAKQGGSVAGMNDHFLYQRK